ncbi:hypothetical protein E2C01_051505 [Portunus trituberculatus]|uniref:Uncharacterized protein n=1 Tax=Portunus trituberculatus TaxID=210409 RepID=A0A5B7GLZ0_PORTR|nr:hypothetical protein [Portunus trituberculatus]
MRGRSSQCGDRCDDGDNQDTSNTFLPLNIHRQCGPVTGPPLPCCSLFRSGAAAQEATDVHNKVVEQVTRSPVAHSPATPSAVPSETLYGDSLVRRCLGPSSWPGGGCGLRANNGIFAPRDDAAKPPDPGFVKTYWPKALRRNGKGEARRGKAKGGERPFPGEGDDAASQGLTLSLPGTGRRVPAILSLSPRQCL